MEIVYGIVLARLVSWNVPLVLMLMAVPCLPIASQKRTQLAVLALVLAHLMICLVLFPLNFPVNVLTLIFVSLPKTHLVVLVSVQLNAQKTKRYALDPLLIMAAPILICACQ